MHIYYPHDPRVKVAGYWAMPGIINDYTEDELVMLNNFLSSFLEDSRKVMDMANRLVDAFRINEEATRVYVSFQHVQTFLNFLDAMGWTYHIQGE